MIRCGKMKTMQRCDDGKNHALFWAFFPKIMKIPKQKIRLMKKRNYKNYVFFCHFSEKWQNRIFHWEWANRGEKLMKAPYRIFYILINPKIVIFGYKDWWQSYRGRSSEVWKNAVFALERQGIAKQKKRTLFFDPKIAFWVKKLRFWMIFF